ncbi:C45 family autoproteolytic acyltransferase/hydolase [Xanthomarina spongicola]|uniref:Acyl-CoA:6-aminopenicillanic acid acyl transferase n=1 Tax=Xanthomarina spongicola TaxID=570520 RepID=A0A316DJC2_9FLAO|nr:C45 family peptidase [Xanthomarina spongicola]PWK17718.1 acyl-CoA:6-aminopenicillanic acid acyl transferase [Xanthomarina spongicola]
MKNIFILLLLLTFEGFGQQANRDLQIITLSGSGYDLGLQHGKQLKEEIGDIISAWKKNTSNALKKDADLVVAEFFEYANFDEAIKKWTPDLYEEVKGIADGSEQNFNDVFVLNLLDEFWVYLDNLYNHHCSSLGVPARNGNPGYISQNMDLENYTDGFQVLMRLKRIENRPEQLILTHPGLIALNGMNEDGIGVCVNTLMELNASASGLPVAFVVRRIINTTDKEDLLSFIQTVNHASGQNYILGIKGEVYDFEASANKVVRYNPLNENGTVYHTNHPIVNDDVKSWHNQFNPNLKEKEKPKKTNSHLRFNAVETRMANSEEINDQQIMDALRSKDDKNNPVCRTNNNNGYGFTFASTIMTMSEKPYIQILAGPPDESDYIRVDFSSK